MTDDQVAAITMAAVIGAGEKGASEKNLLRLLDWSAKALADGVLVGLLIEGRLKVTNVGKGDVTFAVTTAEERGQIVRAGEKVGK